MMVSRRNRLFSGAFFLRCHVNLQGLSHLGERSAKKIWCRSSRNFQRPPVALGVDATNPRRIVWTLEKASLTRRLAEKEGMKYMKYYPAI